MSWRIDRGLLLAIFFFIGLGLVQVYSSSYILAFENHGDGLYFFKRQLMFSFLGVCGLFFVAYLPWRYWEKCGFLLFLLALGGLLLTFIPGLGVKVGGAQRWIQLPIGFRFEPAELLKVSYPLILGLFLARPTPNKGKTIWSLRMFLLLIPLGLLVKQPDFGSFVICSLVMFSMFFAFGLPWKHIISSFVILVGMGTVLVINSPYKMNRVMVYMDPWKDPEQKGFQIIPEPIEFSVRWSVGGRFGTRTG